MVSENCMFIRKLKDSVRLEVLNEVLEKSIWISNKDDLLVKHMPELRQYLRLRIKQLERRDLG